LYKRAKDEGLITEENALKSRSDVETPDISYSQLTSDELTYYSKYAFRKFYFRPQYMIKTILKFINIVRLKIIIKEFLFFFQKYMK
jgi:hypothetical protein